MKTLLLILLIAIPSTMAAGQQPQAADVKKTIEAVDIEGEGVRERLSATLKDELQKLVGQVYDPEAANRFADRIQAEIPEFVAASRTVPGGQPDSVRLVFAVARITSQAAVAANVNARYDVESVEIEGISRSLVSDALYGDMQKMVGKPLDDSEVGRLKDRLRTELGQRFGADHAVVKGSPQHLRVFFYAYKLPWLPFRDADSMLVYHQKQGTSFSLLVPFDLNTKVNVRRNEPASPSASPPPSPGSQTEVKVGSNGINIHFFKKTATTQRIILGAANTADDLLERYKGFRFGYENISLGTNRLGFKLEYEIFNSRWQRSIELAAGPDVYHGRQSLQPSLAFAFSPSLYATAGLQFVNLDMLSPATGSRSASAGVGSLRFRHANNAAQIKHEWNAGYEAHTGARTLDSDYIYTRHFVDAQYTFHQNKNWVSLSGLGGRTTGNAPLFDRFSLGNTMTLRGWNKFDVAPLGGNRVAHGSLQFGHDDDFHVYYDAGAVWNAGQPIHVRSAVGVAVGGPNTNLTLGFRIRGAHLSPMIMIVFR